MTRKRLATSPKQSEDAMALPILTVDGAVDESTMAQSDGVNDTERTAETPTRSPNSSGELLQSPLIFYLIRNKDDTDYGK